MSTITRDVVIRVAVQSAGSSFKPPDVAPATAGMDGFTDATNNAGTAVDNLTNSTDNVTTATGVATVELSNAATVIGRFEGAAKTAYVAVDALATSSTTLANNVSIVGATFKGGFTNDVTDSAEAAEALDEAIEHVAVNTTQLAQGLLLMGRGLALATGASQESTAELVKMFAVVQAGRDALRGATMAMEALKASTESTKAAMAGLVGPIGAVVGIALVSVQAYYAIGKAVEEVRNKIKDMERELSESSVTAIEAGNAMKLRALAFEEGEWKAIELLKTRSELERTLATAVNIGLDQKGMAEAQLKTSEQIITVTESYVSELERAASAQEDEIKAKQESLRLATDLLDKEKERVSTIQASVGALTAAQKVELERLTTKLESGQGLTRREAENLGKYGQGDLAKREFEKLGKGELSDRLTKLRGGESKVDELASARDEARKALGVEDGETAEQAVARELKSLRDNTAAAKKEQIDMIRELLQQQRETQQELARLRQAEIIKKHAKGG